MSKQVITKEKCYIIICREMHCIDKIIGVFKKKADAECFVDTMNSEMTREERRQRYFTMCETEMITDWRLKNK